MTHVNHAARSALLALSLTGLFAGRAAQAQTAFRYIASPALTFEYHGQPDLRLPTAVTVANDGTVYVVDGVRDRILVFSSTGDYRAEIRQVGDQPLARPISAKADRAGVLWIADTGHARVLARAPDGGLLREIRCPKPGGAAHTPEVTDIAVSTDGRHVWLVDNANHRLGHFDIESESLNFVGGQGQALGRFYHPFFLAHSPTGDIFVSEPLNARIQVLTPDGQPTGSLGTFGVELGELYRPKGVALDRVGNVWVVDGTLGVIQVFQPTGLLLDVVRDTQGKPLKLDTPCGLTFDNAGNLYVAELMPNRIQKFTITANPVAPAHLPPPRTPTGGPTQPHACLMCHLEWAEPLTRGESTLLASPPPASPDEPYVSRAEVCLSCHDGSVVDSRRRVWLEHGHATATAPPPTMNVPSRLPLVSGKLACRTCHSAHGTPFQENNLGGVFFLRVPNIASELCKECHTDKAGGPETGSHPLGAMSVPVPATLLKAGARSPANRQELTCQACHTPHGAPGEHLLVLPTDSSQLCITCHDQIRPGMFRPGGEAEHPLNPVVNAEQAAAVHDLGTQLGPDDRLICLSCHKMHSGKTERFLLAEDFAGSQMCLRCHSEKQILANTPHDLRVNFPDEQNRLGLTPIAGGPCSACHLFHRYARPAEPHAIDPGGKCITCHQSGRPGQKFVVGSPNHPSAECTQCHNPHTTQFGHFLRAAAHDVCATCHADHAGVSNGPHDIAHSTSADWPAVSTNTHDPCLACHRPHGDTQFGLFRAGLAPDVPRDDAACLACHPAAAPHAETQTALLHPRAADKLAIIPNLPLSTSDGQKQLACRTCHDPHRAATSDKNLLRTVSGESTQSLCFNCHTEMANIHTIGHAQEPLQAAGFTPAVCTPCHIVHGEPQSIELRYLWPRQLAYAPTTTQPVSVANHMCIACHHTDGPVVPPSIATHPQAEMFNTSTPDMPGYLPLFNAQGDVDPRGTIACRTCHLTHGRTTPAPVPPELGKIESRELRARAWHLRSFGAGSVCTTCHGFDGLRRFMYFHDAVRRAGPLQGTPPAQ